MKLVGLTLMTVYVSNFPGPSIGFHSMSVPPHLEQSAWGGKYLKPHDLHSV